MAPFSLAKDDVTPFKVNGDLSPLTDQSIRTQPCEWGLRPRPSVVDAGPGPRLTSTSRTSSTDLGLAQVKPTGIRPPLPSPLPRGYFPRPPPLVSEPVRHINSTRKASDWHIKIRKTHILIFLTMFLIMLLTMFYYRLF